MEDLVPLKKAAEVINSVLAGGYTILSAEADCGTAFAEDESTQRVGISIIFTKDESGSPN